MKRRIIYHCIAVVFMAIGMSYTQPIPTYSSAPDRVSLGVKIGILPTGELTQYAIIYYKDNKISAIEGVDLNRLVKIGMGEWPIPRTLTFHDFFEEHGMYDDTLADGTIIDYGDAFDSLWKVRFNVHPFDHQLGDGWSQGEIRPSLKQQEYIYDRYGVRGYDQDYFADTGFFQLLKDVMDPIWIANYKSLR